MATNELHEFRITRNKSGLIVKYDRASRRWEAQWVRVPWQERPGSDDESRNYVNNVLRWTP
jgi:hypothetical protein